MSVHSFHLELAEAVVEAGAVPLLVLCIQEPELSLKRIAASALSDICKHSPELAQTVVDHGAIAHLAQMILNPDAKLKVCAEFRDVFKPLRLPWKYGQFFMKFSVLSSVTWISYKSCHVPQGPSDDKSAWVQVMA